MTTQIVSRGFFYNRPHCLRHHKQNQNRLNRDGTHVLPLVYAAHVYMRASTMLRPQYPNLQEGADSVSGQLRGD